MNKKILLLLVFAMLLSASSCGVKHTTPNNEESGTITAENDADNEKMVGNGNTQKSPSKENNDKKEDVSSDSMTAKDFENLVDRFNNTNDEKQKEDARKQIEAILKKAENE